MANPTQIPAFRATMGDWKYYVLVSNDPPTHLFTASYQEFQRAKRPSATPIPTSGRVPATMSHPVRSPRRRRIASWTR